MSNEAMEVSAYTLQPADDARAGLTLPDRMSSFELNYLFNHTNSEIKCLLLGMMDDELSRSPQALADELMRKGAGKFDSAARQTINHALDTFPHALVARTPDELFLTPFGMVAKALAGFNLSTGSANNLPLAIWLGQSKGHDNEPGHEEYSHLRRLGFLAKVVQAGKNGLFAVEAVDEDQGYTVAVAKRLTSTLGDARLLKASKKRKGMRQLIHAEATDRTHTALRAAQGVIEAVINRDEIQLQEGRALIEAMLDTEDIPYFAKRSLAASNRNKKSVLEDFEGEVYGILIECGGQADTGQLHELIGADRYSAIHSLYTTLARTATLPQARFVKIPGTRPVLWQVKDSKASA